MCGIGKMQSPIDLRDKNVVVSNKFGLLRSQYLPSNTTIKNRGHDIMVNILPPFPIYFIFFFNQTCVLLDHHFV